MDLEGIRKELYEGETVEPQQMTTEEAIEALKKMGEDGLKKK